MALLVPVSFLTRRAGRRPTTLLLLLLLGLLPGGGWCGAPAAGVGAPDSSALHRRFFRLIRAGNAAYARKQGMGSISASQQFFDSAQTLALRTQDTLLLASAVFAQGRVYDAWNQEPQKTVVTFRRAAALYRHLPAQRVRYYYVRHLVAHAYDKVPDSTGAVTELRALARELDPLPDTLLRQLPFTVEMALIATQVHNYPLADSILRRFGRRDWIRNDSTTYDYLYHYYLTRARLDLYLHRRPAAPYLDSVALALRAARNVFDRTYYAGNLAVLTAAHDDLLGRPHAAYDYLRLTTSSADSLTDGGRNAHLRQALLRADERAAARRAQYEAAASTARWLIIGILTTALFVISVLSVRLYHQRQASRAQADAVAVVNHQLDDKVAQVELLNKEMQHRVKNNLHMIFSLLHMQERRSTNDEVIENLQAARLRVESIAALHNQLLTNPTGPDLSGFLKALISAVVSCLANDRQVVTHLQTEPLHLPESAYLALSLILNEWVTNSLKYAETEGLVLEINVSVRTRPHEVCIVYADNGLPPAAEPAPGGGAGAPVVSTGLGTQIIQLLTRQLGATLTTAGGHPYHYELCIPRG